MRWGWGTGEGLWAPSHSSPGSLCRPQMGLFTARRQDFLLFEKRAFLWGPRGTAESWRLGLSESETHGRRPPSPAPAGPQGLRWSQTPNIRKHRNRLVCSCSHGPDGDGLCGGPQPARQGIVSTPVPFHPPLSPGLPGEWDVDPLRKQVPRPADPTHSGSHGAEGGRSSELTARPHPAPLIGEAVVGQTPLFIEPSLLQGVGASVWATGRDMVSELRGAGEGLDRLNRAHFGVPRKKPQICAALCIS